MVNKEKRKMKLDMVATLVLEDDGRNTFLTIMPARCLSGYEAHCAKTYFPIYFIYSRRQEFLLESSSRMLMNRDFRK